MEIMIHIISQPEGYVVQIYRADRTRIITASDGTKYRALHCTSYLEVTTASLNRIECLVKHYEDRTTRRRNPVFNIIETIVIV